ncbi:Starch-binding associating with outer membrane [Chitinophaga ginsengisegetis]|uniref:Starch-binding associating with outer membrane n=1 Tax=Chitinophaga ginsengisegetis TaxID=393003 RepID=A0A1T5NL55_9BACT|nr:RagB/SusD family nutrient uptake outer membrane protein [Chitinophaga ginsengisegetis]SKD00878.1 Starch-binding associating with outer membrane [Chitinophaga ginsengisegetis]
MKQRLINYKTLVKYIACFLILFVLATSCKKDFLEKKPGYLSSEGFYQTDQQAEQAMNAAYYPLLSFWTNKVSFESDVLSDDAVKGQGSDLAALNSFDILNIDAASDPIKNNWADNYTGIYRCNLVLDNVQPDSDTKKRVLGEAHFLRAFFYYRLVIRYGGVSLSKTTLGGDIKLPRSTADETYQFIIDELSQAESLLPYPADVTSVNVGRANRGAASSLKGITYLQWGKYQDAYNVLKAVVSNAGGKFNYGLTPNFLDLFKVASNNNKESVFEAQTREGADFDQSNGFNFWVRPRNGSTIFGLGFCLPTKSLFDEFESGDPRRAASIFAPGDIISDEPIPGSSGDNVNKHPFQAAWAPETGYGCAKYVKGIFVGNNAEKTGQNKRLIRYAEVLLAFAEAAYKTTGHDNEAWDAISQVRTRAFGYNKPSPHTQLFDAIVHERRVELALEGKRYFDLLRWGLADRYLGALGYRSETKGLYPVPIAELDANPNSRQNAGF